LRKKEEEERTNSQASKNTSNLRRKSELTFAFFVSKIILKMQKKGLVEIVPDDEEY
jgi:hypothetical protein